MVDKYVIRSRLSEQKTREVFCLFASDIETTKIAKLIRLSRNAVNRLLKAIRVRIADICENESIFACKGVLSCHTGEHVSLDATVYTDGFKTYDGLLPQTLSGKARRKRICQWK